MIEGWLLYHREDYEKNRWFAGELIRQGGRSGLNIRLIVAEDTDIAGEAPPAFAVNRTRDWRAARVLEQRGCRVFNPSETARVGNDKLASYALAARLGIPQLESSAHGNRPQCLLAQPFGYPVVLKDPHGHGGHDVYLAWDDNELIERAALLPCTEVLVQRFGGRLGEDVRVYVLGGEILTAVKRFSHGDFRANLSLGGSVEYYELNDEERELVRRVAGALRLDYAGVDFLLDENGRFLFNEIEDAVGARGLYRLGGFDIIGLFVQHIRKELDSFCNR